MKTATSLALLALSTALVACGSPDPDPVDPTVDPAVQSRVDALETDAAELEARTDTMMAGTDTGAEMERGTFDVKNASGMTIGTVLIADTMDGVDVTLDVTAIPEGNHAIHFHENGTCDGPEFTSAGGHYNPTDRNHGFDAPSPSPHAGDMRNFDAPQSGVVQTTVANERVSLSMREGMAPLRDANGTALIIHAEADDYTSQPAGAAGARIACAVIG